MFKFIRTLLSFVVLVCLFQNSISCPKKPRIRYEDVCEDIDPEPVTQRETSTVPGVSGQESNVNTTMSVAVTTPSRVPVTTKVTELLRNVTVSDTLPNVTVTTTKGTPTDPITIGTVTETISTVTVTTTEGTPTDPSTIGIVIDTLPTVTVTTTALPPTTTTVVDEVCRNVTVNQRITEQRDCPESWSLSSFGCHKIITQTTEGGSGTANYDSFASVCTTEGGIVAAPKSREMVDIFEDLLGRTPTLKHVFIGLRATMDTFTHYEDGTRVNFTNWDTFQPSTRFNHTQCVVHNVTSWYVVPCYLLMDGLYCEMWVTVDTKLCGEELVEFDADEEIEEECQFIFANQQQRCEDGWVAYPEAGKCYQVNKEKKSHDEHVQIAGSLQATLVSIHSNGQMEFLRELFHGVATGSPSFYIGLSRDNSIDKNFGTFEDGSIIDYAMFHVKADRKAIDKKGELCVTDFEKKNKVQAHWVSVRCSDSYPAIYSKNAVGQWNKDECSDHVVVKNYKNGRNLWSNYGFQSRKEELSIWLLTNQENEV